MVEQKTQNLLIRDVPFDLVRKAKKRALDEETTLKELVTNALRQYLITK